MEEYDLTAHANRDELLEFVGSVDPKVVVLGHGEPESKAWFADQIKTKHPKIKVVITDPGKPVEC
jgi:Cft2 family RNA processing exonuclease